MHMIPPPALSGNALRPPNSPFRRLQEAQRLNPSGSHPEARLPSDKVLRAWQNANGPMSARGRWPRAKARQPLVSKEYPGRDTAVTARPVLRDALEATPSTSLCSGGGRMLLVPRLQASPRRDAMGNTTAPAGGLGDTLGKFRQAHAAFTICRFCCLRSEQVPSKPRAQARLQAYQLIRPRQRAGEARPARRAQPEGLATEVSELNQPLSGKLGRQLARQLQPSVQRELRCSLAST
ncbi:hypothetical protein CC85DRAFT_80483 [Cutaneotrichosporon oleaginosum]|uniref:Uncharacterized protein n=1 Tax=Cutaneotrichosporon oleaginosum TaxID=879819 RepID=A0A0J1B4M4_9TREE|nr:uncharacterized protein CC85DRAFT_80483 [Cutaneotrichosporon oleaginosum]KLT42624.1 hypothetical protein CC85DRAFT_80483 [Cutaneotrichosporon oleaginosum]TXT05259.1 hypothetical protein COLE_06579 [Cutaneotrichosporon oleaginosum]